MAVASPPPAQESPDDEQIDAALEVIRGIRPDLHDQAIDKWNALDKAGDSEGLDHLAVQIVQLAARLETHQQQQPNIQPKAQPRAQLQPKAKPAPIPVPTPPVSRTNTDLTRRVFGATSLLFGIPLWVVGAHYTLDGWTFLLNVVFDLVRSGVVLPLASGVWALLLFPIGVMYSIGERAFIPFGKIKGRWTFLGWGVLLVWAVVNSTDLGSTYLGIANPAPDSWPITQWMAATLWAKMVWIGVVTYIPEILLSFGWRWLRGR